MSRAWVTFKRIVRLIRFLLICLVLTICIFLIWRVFSTGTPKEIKNLDANEKLKTVYAEKGEGLYVFDQIYDQITRADRNAGYFAIPEAKFIPDANQAQIVFRYNNSTIKALKEDYKLSAVPSREEELFDVSLVLYIDLTPSNEEDNHDIGSDTVKTIRITPTSSTPAKSKLYNFYRYVFDFENGEESVDLDELLKSGTLIAVHAQIYYKGDLNYEETAYGAVCVYDYRRDNDPVKLSKDEKEALGN